MMSSDGEMKSTLIFSNEWAAAYTGIYPISFHCILDAMYHLSYILFLVPYLISHALTQMRRLGCRTANGRPSTVTRSQ